MICWIGKARHRKVSGLSHLGCLFVFQQFSADTFVKMAIRKSLVNGGEKPWRSAGSGGRLNRAAPKCSVVDFVIPWKAVIMAGFRVKDPEKTSDAGVHQYGDLG